MIINVLSDNANRATADVKSTVNKRNGKIAEQGSVMFMYDKKGKIDVPAVLDEEVLLDAAIEAEIDDFLLEEVRKDYFESFQYIPRRLSSDISTHKISRWYT